MVFKSFNHALRSIGLAVITTVAAAAIALSAEGAEGVEVVEGVQGAEGAPPTTGVFAGTKISKEAAMHDSTSVFPDGRGLPEGKGDANQGKALYMRHCIACHGSNGTNGINDRLTGGTGSLTTNAPIKTIGSYWPYATTLFDYIARAMPYNAPGTLNTQELYSVTAYLLSLNKIIDADATLDQHSLPLVVMPNRDGFDWLSPQ